MNIPAKIYYSQQRFICEGEWNVSHLSTLKPLFAKLSLPMSGEVIIDGSQIKKMDTAGAFILSQWLRQISAKKMTPKLVNFSEKSQKLIHLIEQRDFKPETLPPTTKLGWVSRIGKMTVGQFQEFYLYLAFIGELSFELLRILRRPTRLRYKALFSNVYRTGCEALPIIGLLSFMIGVVLTYQMGVQLRAYGANIFIVDLLGLAVLREFGPLLTAIMIAGRTGSSFTAELGLMKSNQEINALDTMGVTPGELLLLPKIFGLLIALPLLTIWADIFGVFGGMVMSNSLLNLTWADFLNRFQHQIPVKALIIGLGKTPIFALIISSIGCFQGISVEDTADSIGKNTTKSVVLAIFFIIVADAIFSIIFSKLKL